MSDSPRIKIKKSDGSVVEYALAVLEVVERDIVTEEPRLMRIVPENVELDVREHNDFITAFVPSEVFKLTMEK